MKKRDMQTVFDSMRKIAEKRYPMKDTADEQFKAYGKLGLLIFCEAHGKDFNEYLDLLEGMTA